MKPLRKTRKVVAADSPPSRQEASRELREFCSLASHELSNLLGVVLGELEYAKNRKAQTPERTFHLITKAAEKALSIGRNLAYFAVHPHLELESADTSQLLLDTLEIVEKEMAIHNIQVAALTESSVFGIVDPGALQQIIFNVFSVIARVLPAGGKTKVTLAKDKKVIRVNIVVDSTNLNRNLFDVLDRSALSEENLRWKSDRLKLSVAKHLARGLGGALTITSQKDISFQLTLPFDSRHPKPAPYSNRRRHRRISVSFPVVVQLDRSELVQSETRRLSVGGCLVAWPKHLRVQSPQINDSVSLKILYFDDEVIEIPLARVANLPPMAGGLGIGLEFGALSDKAKKIIGAIVKSHTS